MAKRGTITGDRSTRPAHVCYLMGRVLYVPLGMALVTLMLLPFLAEPGVIAWPGFLLCAALALMAALLFTRQGRKPDRLSLKTALVAAAAAWLLCTLITALPFYVTAELSVHNGNDNTTLALFRDPVNAGFEAMSGMTSTGLTIVDKESQLPASLVWWRSLSQWIGGLGILIFMVVFSDPNGRMDRLFSAELNSDMFAGSAPRTARRIVAIYLAYTLAAVSLLYVAGMPGWHALNYGLTGISTGGFGSSDNSLADFPVTAQLAMIPIMIAGAIAFYIHYQILRGKLDALSAPQPRALLLGIVVVSGLVYLGLVRAGQPDITLTDVLFQSTSAFATAGFSSVTLGDWPVLVWLILIPVMIIGGSAGSTAGGYKIARALRLLKGYGLFLKRVLKHPELMFEQPEDLTPPPSKAFEDRLQTAVLLLLIWFITLGIGILLLLLSSDAAAGRILFDATSALSGVGLSSGMTGAELGTPAKLVLMSLMWLGRLEIIPILLLLFACVSYALQSERLTLSPADAQRRSN